MRKYNAMCKDLHALSTQLSIAIGLACFCFLRASNQWGFAHCERQGSRVCPMPSALCPRRPWHFSYRLLYRVIVVLIGRTWHLCSNGNRISSLSHTAMALRSGCMAGAMRYTRYTIRHPAIPPPQSIGYLRIAEGHPFESNSHC